MISRRAASLFVLLLAGCGELPRDTAGTSERVRGGTMRVGEAGPEDARLRALMEELSAETGSRAEVTRGPAEPLLMRLEGGELDLVVGAFDRKTPWTKRVTFSKPLAAVEGPHGVVELKGATRNGEHRWAMEVDRAVARLKQ